MKLCRHLDFYLLRSSLLPLEKTVEFLRIQTIYEQEAYLKSLYSDSRLQEALFLSSPDLFDQVKKWLDKEIVLSDKLLNTLYKYTIRLGTRSTPFGLFAGVSLGKVCSTHATPQMKRNQENTIQYRLDMEYFLQVMHDIKQDPIIRKRLKYRVNTTLYAQGKVYKYYQQQSNPKGNVNHYLKQIQSTPVLDYVLLIAKEPHTYDDLMSLLIKKGANNAQAEQFFKKIIDNGLLVCQLSVHLTTNNLYTDFITQLARVDLERKYLPMLEKIEGILHSKDSRFAIHHQIQSLSNKWIPTAQTKNQIQGDLLLGTDSNTLPQADIEKIVGQLSDLIPLAEPLVNNDLVQFKKQFHERYEDRMIPLLEVLDPDCGIGYGNVTEHTKLDSIITDISSVNSGKSQPGTNHLTQLVSDHVTYGQIQLQTEEFVLTEDSIRNLGNVDIENGLPSTFYVLGNLMYDHSTDGEPLFCLQACGGTSAGNLLSRFGYLDPVIEEKISEVTQFEQKAYENAIIAEIVHLPEARTGNILQRVHGRVAEIGLMTGANDNILAIDINELYIFLRNNKVVLWSKRLGSQIIPKLTTAHNFKTGMNIYRFLGDIQAEMGYLNLKLNIADSEKRVFWPRVRYKNIIVSRATWNLPKITHKRSDNETIPALVKAIKSQYKLPEKMVLSQGDNELLLDLSNPISRKILYESLCKQNVVLYEYLWSDHASPVRDGINSYANEIIIPLVTDRKYKALNFQNLNQPNVQRKFTLGSEWVYAKIYCSLPTAERLLKNVIPTIIDGLENSDVLKKWFFIRYTDPDHHIRLRIEAKDKESFNCIVTAIHKATEDLLATGHISTLQFDTYSREIERYTAKNMDLSEELFHQDSQNVVSLLQNHPNVTDRWPHAVSGMLQYIQAMEMDTIEKLDFVEKMRKMFFKEFGSSKQNDRALNLTFRSKRKLIENIVTQAETGSTNKSILLKHIISRLDSESNVHTRDKKQSVVASYIHMFINRLFDTDQRKYEYALYHLLSQYYRSVVAKHKQVMSTEMDRSQSGFIPSLT